MSFSAAHLRATASWTSQPPAPARASSPGDLSWMDAQEAAAGSPPLKALERQRRRGLRTDDFQQDPGLAFSKPHPALAASFDQGTQPQSRPPAAPGANASAPAAWVAGADPYPSTATVAKSYASPLPHWSRAALEARVATLERMLQQGDAQANGSTGAVYASDRELSEHLQVTVRKNRELRAEREVAKTRVARLEEEKRGIMEKLALDKTALQSLLQDTSQAKESLQASFKALIQEKQELQARLAKAEADNAALLRRGVARAAESIYGVDPAVLQGNVDDVQAINSALMESLRVMRERG
jgi:hypothetical protein